MATLDKFLLQAELAQREAQSLELPYPHSKHLWCAEGALVWVKRSGEAAAQKDPRSGEIANLVSVAQNILTEAECTCARNELHAASSISDEQREQLRGRFSQQADIAQLLTSLEFALRLSFHCPQSREAAQLGLHLRSSIPRLRTEGLLGDGVSQNPHLNLLHELFCFKRLLEKWETLPDAVKRQTLRAGIDRCTNFGAVNSHEQRILCEQLQRGLDRAPLVNPVILATLVDAVACVLPYTTPSVLQKLRRLFPTLAPHAAIEPGVEAARSAVPGEKRLRNEQDDEAVVAADNRAAADAGGASSAAAAAPEKRARLDLIQPVPHAELAPRSAAAVAVATEGRPPVAARAVSLHHHRPVAPPASSGRPAAGTVGAVVLRPASAAVVATHAARPGEFRNQHPCRSIYHAKYSTAEKHGSDSCRFCVVCHMMEFLFNGCVVDCCWKHFPTERKIAHNLRYHPSVAALARRRLTSLVQGTPLAPMRIDL